MSDDQPRPTATDDDKFILTIEDVGNLYAQAGFDRTIRTLQRYCERGHLDSRKKETLLGYMYLITSESVERHISQLRQFGATTEVAADRGAPRLAAVDVAPKVGIVSEQRPSATDDDQPRPTATVRPVDDRYIISLERENIFLREQVVVKDTQIGALLERDKETNTLIHRLQAMLAPLLTAPSERHSAPQPTEPTGGAQ
jgi:hypothetical protein